MKRERVATWDCIYFGKYWQNDTNGDGKVDKNDAKQPIKWRVLSVDGDDAFLLADQNLDCQPYNEEATDVTWETCTLRQWLNNDFYQNAFDSSEQSAIRTTNVVNADNPYYGTEGGNNTSDNVYLLSIDEASNAAYGFCSAYDKDSETREAKNTEYAKECGAYTNSSGSYAGNGGWWLRSPCYSYIAAYVYSSGYVYDDGNFVDCSSIAVRPALHLNLSSTKWSKAGAVSSSGEGSAGETATPAPTVIPTPTPAPTVTQTPMPTGGETITPPAKITLQKAINKGKKISLSWKKIKDAKGYQIQYADNKKWKKKKSKWTKKTKYTIKKLKKKKTYYIRVRAYKLDGSKKVYGSWSKVKKVKVKK